MTPLGRRRFLQLGGIAVASAAVLASCTGDEDEVEPDGDSGGGAASDADIAILRTATSLELLAVDVYGRVIDAGLFATPAVGDAAERFRSHHEEHAELLQSVIADAGGAPSTAPDSELLGQLQPRLDGLSDEAGAGQLVYELENVIAQTYLSSVGRFTATRLNQAVMSVGGVEARHAAILAPVIGQPGAPQAFLPTAMAVAIDAGV